MPAVSTRAHSTSSRSHEVPNRDVTTEILRLTGRGPDLIRHVKDRLGHDRRYALDSSNLAALGWAPRFDFETGMAETVRWYAENEDWWRPLKSGEFRAWYERQYANR